LPSAVIDKSVSFAGWRAIDAAEIRAAAEGKVRRKISSRAELLRIASEGDSNPVRAESNS
jgi:hypothetical protein